MMHILTSLNGNRHERPTVALKSHDMHKPTFPVMWRRPEVTWRRPAVTWPPSWTAAAAAVAVASSASRWSCVSATGSASSAGCGAHWGLAGAPSAYGACCRLWCHCCCYWSARCGRTASASRRVSECAGRSGRGVTEGTGRRGRPSGDPRRRSGGRCGDGGETGGPAGAGGGRWRAGCCPRTDCPAPWMWGWMACGSTSGEGGGSPVCAGRWMHLQQTENLSVRW